MHSKNCCTLFLLALVACQAAPSPKIIDKSINETGTKLPKENFKIEDTGAEKDRAKKSTTFCVEVHSGKEELVPCNQEIKLPFVKTPDYKPFVQTAYEVPNVVVQQPQPQVPHVVVQQPQPQVSVQPTITLPAQSLSSQTVLTSPSLPQQQLVFQPQPSTFVQPTLVSQPVVTPTNPAPTPIINYVPAPVSKPCDKPSVLETQLPSQIYTVPVVQRPQPVPQPPVFHHVQHVRPLKVQEEIKLPTRLPAPSVIPVARPSCKPEMIVAPPSPVEVFYHEEEPKYVEYLPSASQESYECSCRTEALKNKLRPQPVMLYPGSGPLSFRSPLTAVQYNPSVVGSEGTSPVVLAAQAREAV